MPPLRPRNVGAAIMTHLNPRLATMGTNERMSVVDSRTHRLPADDATVVREVLVLGPRVEAPVDTAPLPLSVGDERGTHVPHPGVVVRHLDHAYYGWQQRARGGPARR